MDRLGLHAAGVRGVRRVSRFEAKTEKPTRRRRRKARREGQTGRSAEGPIALSLVGAVIVAKFILPAAARSLSTGMRSILTTAGTAPAGAGGRGGPPPPGGSPPPPLRP